VYKHLRKLKESDNANKQEREIYPYISKVRTWQQLSWDFGDFNGAIIVEMTLDDHS
jgi:hypothetical protein